jgi:hypothetical protein
VGKAFVTEVGYEAANLGMQVLGGHGYVRANGMEQIVRDTRIALLYEGTSAIQALDLLGRKVMGSGGALLKSYQEHIEAFCVAQDGREDMSAFVQALRATSARLEGLTWKIAESAMKNAEEADAAALEYLMILGYLVLAHMWAWMARVAADALAGGSTETEFYTAKIETAHFYFQRVLPRIESLALCVEAGGASITSIPQNHFAA